MPCNLSDLMEKKLLDKDFREIFIEECCICIFTLEIQQAVNKMKLNKDQMFSDQEFSQSHWDDLLSGDYCNPDLAFALAKKLNIKSIVHCLKKTR